MKAHRTDGVSLGFGFVFLFFTAWWVLAQFVTLALPAVGWIVALSLIMFGLAGLVGAFRAGRGAVPAPTSGAPISAPPGSGLPTGMHADIVRELMENQRTSGGVGIDDTRVETPPAPTAAFAPITPPEPVSPYATDYLTVSDPPASSADDATQVIDDTPTTEIKAGEVRPEGDDGRR
ncbi:hypothetical protein [Catenuloplanes atrovinosus]|uniref:Uncharacterized protein n=1 Tax=Catenuloplanes atrovinosus TaxID=137266 RepID=A0AAE3YVM5_9ACTN|nr:hypothetical protein [Catenuloplanes atrovinosus]MDR7279370.1 hypothetical protein [Catenuloplanes atrovinosus]